MKRQPRKAKVVAPFPYLQPKVGKEFSLQERDLWLWNELFSKIKKIVKSSLYLYYWQDGAKVYLEPWSFFRKVVRLGPKYTSVKIILWTAIEINLFLACACSTDYGAVDEECRREDGQCSCKAGFAGRQCEQCAAGYYQYPYCEGMFNNDMII